MKICLTGAGSTRLPLMMASMVGAGCAIDDVTLFDIRPERVRALLSIGLELCCYVGTPPRFTIADTFHDAVEGCDALIMTIRPGFEEQRAGDERTCLDLGVIGQETTGPAGFAFATRTIPAVAGYCATAERLAPGYLPVVFTNPAGMVTRALLDLGFDRAVGICDSATVATKKVAARSGLRFEDVAFEVSGLNHLSWTRRVTGPDGEDLLGPAMDDRTFMAAAVPWMPGRLSRADGIPVEYLYYYMCAPDALKAILSEPKSRGETLAETNRGLFADLAGLGTSDAIGCYARYLAGRNDTYMSYALGHRHGGAMPMTTGQALAFLSGEIGGYAEVAMDLLAAARSDRTRIMALNVRNNGAVPELPDSDVVETDCEVDSKGIRPALHVPMPAAAGRLVSDVATYERLAVRAIFLAMKGQTGQATATAIDALTAHPLVRDRLLAERLAGGLFGRNGLTVQPSSDMVDTIFETRP